MLKSIDFCVCVLLVSNFVFIYAQDTVISIRFDKIRLEDHEYDCTVLEPSYYITEGYNFTFDIVSHYYIVTGEWSHGLLSPVNLLGMKNTNLNISYANLPPRSLTYHLRYTEKAVNTSVKFRTGKWEFTFEIITEENKLFSFGRHNALNYSKCKTDVHFVKTSKFDIKNGADTKSGFEVNVVAIIVGTVTGAAILVQMAYIIYFKVKSRTPASRSRCSLFDCSENVYSVTVNENNIADRPPLPLPPEVNTHQVPPLPGRFPPSALKDAIFNKAVEKLPPPIPVPSPSKGKFRKPIEKLPPPIPVPSPSKGKFRKPIEKLPPPIPVPSPSKGQFRKPIEKLPPRIPVPSPSKGQFRKPNWHDSSDEDWDYEPL